MLNILEQAHTWVLKQLEKTKKKQNKLVDAFCKFLYSWEEGTDWYYVGNSEIWWVFCVWDSYFNVSDIELYMKLNTPEQVWKCYRDFTDYKSKDWLLNLAHYIDIVFIWKDKDCCSNEECEEDEVEYIYNKHTEKEEVVYDSELKNQLNDDWVWVNEFIKDLHTGNELYSKRQWQFVQWENCFIDDTLHYCRVWWIEWVDYEYISKPVEESVQWWTYWLEWTWKLEYKFISDIETEHIENILKTQNLKPSLRKVFELCLKRRWLN